MISMSSCIQANTSSITSMGSRSFTISSQSLIMRWVPFSFQVKTGGDEPRPYTVRSIKRLYLQEKNHPIRHGTVFSVNGRLWGVCVWRMVRATVGTNLKGAGGVPTFGNDLTSFVSLPCLRDGDLRCFDCQSLSVRDVVMIGPCHLCDASVVSLRCNGEVSVLNRGFCVMEGGRIPPGPPFEKGGGCWWMCLGM